LCYEGTQASRSYFTDIKAEATIMITLEKKTTLIFPNFIGILLFEKHLQNELGRIWLQLRGE